MCSCALQRKNESCLTQREREGGRLDSIGSFHPVLYRKGGREKKDSWSAGKCRPRWQMVGWGPEKGGKEGGVGERKWAWFVEEGGG